ncbi:MAG TPA: HEAT repeat domain-containing protein [Caulobacteraceae bacterium]|nr:HEAT repeat domain-containing protein [Caulobacteraceae bacterium]
MDARTALTRGTGDQRWAAARALGDRPGDPELLGRALSNEPDPRVREAIFNSLIHAHSATSVEALLPHLRADDANLRTGALDALKVMSAVAAPSLPELLHDRDPDVRLLACEIARELPGAQATALLCRLLEGEGQVNVCGAAVEVLAEIGGSEALPALARCAERFADEPFLVFSIRTASSRIGPASAEPIA